MKQQFKHLAGISIAAIIALSGCSSNGGDSNSDTTPAEGSISGSVVAGNVKNATVTIHDICKDNDIIATAKTDANGNFTLDVALESGKVYKLTASGGKYTSEATLAEEENGDLTGLISVDLNSSHVSITPLTTMAVSRLKALASACSDIDTAKVKEAAGLVADTYGLDDATKLLTVKPDLSDPTKLDAFKYGFTVGVLEELAVVLDTKPKDLYRALAADIADGKFDGKEHNTTITLEAGKPLPPTAGVADTVAATFHFIESNTSAIADLDINDTVVKDVAESLVEDVSSAPVTDTSSGFDITNSGAITSVSSKGKQLLFVAGRDNGLMSVDITNPDSNLTKTNLDGLNTQLRDYGLWSIGGVIAVPGTQKALVYAYDSTTVALVDLENEGNESVIATADINISHQQSFSGGNAYISSGLPQPSVNGIWLATADGYKLLDISTMTVTKEVPLAKHQIIAENIGGSTKPDINMLFSPNYGAIDEYGWASGGGLQIVNLDTYQAYAMEDENKSSPTSFYQTIGKYPSMGMADAGSVDSEYKVGIITPEDARTVALIRLDHITLHDNNVSDPIDNTFSIDSNSSVAAVTLSSDYSLEVSGVYTDSSSHMALFMAGYSSDIVVAKLQDPEDANWTGLSQWNYALDQYNYSQDPHAGAVIKSMTNGKPYGYLLDYSGDIIQIDMQAFLDANATEHQIDPSMNLYDAGILKRITE